MDGHNPEDHELNDPEMVGQRILFLTCDAASHADVMASHIERLGMDVMSDLKLSQINSEIERLQAAMKRLAKILQQQRGSEGTPH